MGNIVIPGFPTGMLVPGIYLNVELGKAPPSAARVRKVLLVGTNSAGAAASDLPNTLYRVSRLNSKFPKPDDTRIDMTSAEDLFGVTEGYIDAGDYGQVPDPSASKLYWMCKAAFKANPSVSLYAIRVETNYATALSKVANQRFDYIVVEDNSLSTVEILAEHLEGMAAPKIGLRQQGIIGSYASEGTADLRNRKSARIQYVWAPLSKPTAVNNVKKALRNGDFYDGGMLAAAMASVRARFESIDPAVNLCFEQVPGVPAPDKQTKTTLNSLLQDGVSPLVTSSAGTVVLRSVTTAANPADNPNPVLDTGKVTVTDYVADDIEIKMLNRYTGFKLAPDTDVPPPARTATPNGIKNALLEWLRAHEAAGRITSVESLADAVRVEIDPDADGRINFEIAEDVIEIFAVGAGNIIQMG